MRSLSRYAVHVLVFFVACSIFLITSQVLAQQTKEELESSISTTNDKIKELQAEIGKLQSQIATTATEKATLQSAVKAITLNIEKLQKNIQLTRTQINQKDSQLSTLSTSIATTSTSIRRSEIAVGEALRQIHSLDDMPLGVLMLASDSISSFFEQAQSIGALQLGLQDQIKDLSSLKISLEGTKIKTEEKRSELASLQKNLNQQQQGLAINRESQTKLLTETKNKETAYQALLTQKKKQQKQFESDLTSFEAKLKLTIDLQALPESGSGALFWPVESVRITQYFGNTPFATANPQVYNGGGHNAIDLAASPGTPIKSARKGVVVGTGNTDTTCPSASYGKWVFIKHDNGLSTIYAHLSTISVSTGQQVATNELIGYSGTTGYATGPHLHFGVYASDGVQIASFPSKSCAGKVYTMPVADIKAYLNPLTYLPKL